MNAHPASTPRTWSAAIFRVWCQKFRHRFKAPVFDPLNQSFWEFGRQFVSLLRKTGFIGQVEGIRLFRFAGQVED